MRHHEIVESDRFDRADLTEMSALMPKLRRTLGEIEDATPAGTDLGPDLWSSLIRLAPQKKGAPVPASHRVNEAVIDRIWEADSYRDLKQYTAGDPVACAMGMSSLARSVTSMLGELDDVAEQAEKAQAAQDAVEQAMAGLEQAMADDAEGDGSKLSAGPSPEEELESLRSKAEIETELLESMLDEQLPKIDSAVRAALGEAAADAEAQAEAAAGWDMSPGEMSRMDPADRLRIMASLDDERIREIADLMGAMVNTALGQRDRTLVYRPGEIVGVTLGGNLSRLIPAELAALAVPELEDLLMLRVAKRRAREYLTQIVERAGRGAIILLEDQSGSMSGAKGRWSKAFGGALYKIAREQDRAFHAFCFQGPGVWQRFDFPNPKTVAIEDLLAFMSTEPDGGTEVTGPLDEAVALLQAEYDKGGNIEGDIVLATDGEVGVPPAWLTEFQATRDRLQFHVYGLAIRARLSTLHQLCTHVADVTDLTSGNDVRGVFATVN